MSYWLEPDPIKISASFADAVGGHPLIARLLARRGITDPVEARAFLDSRYYKPADPTELPDLERAVEVLRKARANHQRLCIWGDFDVDGQTSTVLLVDGLMQLGFDVFYYIPERATESHGLNADGLKKVIDQGADLIVTCDCGVGNPDEIEFAYQQGAKVIVTDHHELLPELPKCEAVINPQRLPEGHPLSYLCGVGVAYMLIKILFEVEGRAGQAEQWLDLVALGTVADVALLQGDNRYLVQSGLPKLMYDPRPGLSAIFETGEISPSELMETEIVGFGIAPRLNAAGRLAHAREAVALLLGKNRIELNRMATDLEVYNERRKQLCDDVEEEAERILRYQPQFMEQPALVLSGADWPPGVIGIVASRLVEKYDKPTILISTSAEEDIGRASARSVKWLHLQDAIFRHQKLLIGGGGHAMAAGFAIKPENIPKFRETFQKTVTELMPKDNRAGLIQIDDFVETGEINIDFVRDLYRLAPFGAGNPKPILICRNAEFKNIKRLGATGLHTRLMVVDQNGNKIQGLWWRKSADEVPTGRVDVAFRVGLNEFRGACNPQVIIEDAQPHVEPIIEIDDKKPAAPFQIEDFRNSADRHQLLKDLLAKSSENIQIWAEGKSARKINNSCSRLYLKPFVDLLIWTSPADPKTLRDILDQIKPKRIYLLTSDDCPESPTEFVQNLAEAIKYILVEKEGKARFSELASLSGHRESTVKQGLNLLVEMGKLSYSEVEDQIQIKAKRAKIALKVDQNVLKNLLQETAAYRRYFNRAKLEDLLK